MNALQFGQGPHKYTEQHYLTYLAAPSSYKLITLTKKLMAKIRRILHNCFSSQEQRVTTASLKRDFVRMLATIEMEQDYRQLTINGQIVERGKEKEILEKIHKIFTTRIQPSLSLTEEESNSISQAIEKMGIYINTAENREEHSQRQIDKGQQRLEFTEIKREEMELSQSVYSISVLEQQAEIQTRIKALIREEIPFLLCKYRNDINAIDLVTQQLSDQFSHSLFTDVWNEKLELEWWEQMNNDLVTLENDLKERLEDDLISFWKEKGNNVPLNIIRKDFLEEYKYSEEAINSVCDRQSQDEWRKQIFPQFYA